MITAIVILSVIVVVLGFTTINLLRKNEKQEDILLGYLKYLDKYKIFLMILILKKSKNKWIT